jgi:hypothetical protein
LIKTAHSAAGTRLVARPDEGNDESEAIVMDLPFPSAG